MIQAIAIRAIVYVGEANWSFREDWDGNDFTATHMLAYVDGEPAGSLRIRYFGDFAKCERLAVLPKFRTRRYGGRGVAWELCDAGVEFCLKKGFTRFYGQPLKERVPFWSKIGRGMMKPIPNAEIRFGDKVIVPMAGELPPRSDAITIASDHYVIVRREGSWEVPGFWETLLQAPPTPIPRAA